MYKAILVAKDIKAGQRIITAMRRSGVEIISAFWRYFDEEQFWRLVIVTPDLSSRGPQALYFLLSTLMYDSLNSPGELSGISIDQIMLVPPSSLLFKHVQQGAGLGIASGHARNIVFEDVYLYQD